MTQYAEIYAIKGKVEVGLEIQLESILKNVGN